MKKRKTKKINSVFWLFLRYLILLILGIIFTIPSALHNILYNILLKITIYPTYMLLNLFFEAILYNNLILLDLISIEIIPACVAVSAYFLLLILNLTTPMPKKQRIPSIIFSFILLLLINILRIIFFSFMLINKLPYFNIIHQLTWYVFSIILVIGIWFLTAHIFKIKTIPIYTDILKIIRIIKKH